MSLKDFETLVLTRLNMLAKGLSSIQAKQAEHGHERRLQLNEHELKLQNHTGRLNILEQGGA